MIEVSKEAESAAAAAAFSRISMAAASMRNAENYR